MEYLWIASITAILAGKWLWAIVMYLFLFHGCHILSFPAFAKRKPWIGTALGVCVAALFVPKIHWVQWGVTVLQSILYFGVWYPCLQGIREMEATYGNLNAHGIFCAYWVELVMAITGIYVLAIPLAPWFDKMIPPAMILVQTWKGYLLYGGYRNYETRRRQLAALEEDA